MDVENLVCKIIIDATDAIFEEAVDRIVEENEGEDLKKELKGCAKMYAEVIRSVHSGLKEFGLNDVEALFERR